MPPSTLQVGAGDVGGLVRGEEQRGIGDVLRRAEAAERRLGEQRLGDHRLLHVAADQRRLHIAGAERIHADAVRRIFDGETPRQRRHRALGRRIDRHLPRMLGGHHRGQIDDRGVARGFQQIEGLARAAHRAVDIGLPHFVPGCVVEMAEVAPLADAGIVHEHVEPAESIGDPLHQRLHLNRVGDVDRLGLSRAVVLDDGVGGLARRLAVAVGDHHVSAFAGKGLGDGAADAGAGTRDERDLVLKPPHLTPPWAPALPICAGASPAPRRRLDGAPWSRRTAPWSRPS